MRQQRRDPSLINFEHLLKMHYKLDFDEVKAHKYISKIDPNYVYDDLYPETLLGLLARGYTHNPYVTTELINDLIERTDPVYLTPHTGSSINIYQSPLRLLLCNAVKHRNHCVDNQILCLIRKMIAKMDFSLPDSVQQVLQIIAAVKNTYFNFNTQIREEYGPNFTELLVPDLVLKGALIYSDVIRIMNREQDVENMINLLYLFNKANIRVDAGIVDDLFEFV
jgi:hypothetical protein